MEALLVIMPLMLYLGKSFPNLTYSTPSTRGTVGEISRTVQNIFSSG